MFIIAERRYCVHVDDDNDYDSDGSDSGNGRCTYPDTKPPGVCIGKTQIVSRFFAFMLLLCFFFSLRFAFGCVSLNLFTTNVYCMLILILIARHNKRTHSLTLMTKRSRRPITIISLHDEIV